MDIFLDLDNVCNRLQLHWLEAIRLHLGEEILPDSITTWDRLGDKKYLQLLEEPGFFRHLPAADGLREGVGSLQAMGHRIFILSAAGPWNYADKDAWVHEHMDIPVAHVIFATVKQFLAAPGRVLIDDGAHNITAWRERSGVGVVFDQPYNRHECGLRVRSWSEIPGLIRSVAEEGAA